MEDKRRLNGGHSTKPQRADDKRKLTKAQRYGLPELMRKCVSQKDWEDMFEKCIKEAKGGSYKHFQLLLEYNFGKPKQEIDMTQNGEMTINTPTITFIK